MSVKRRDSKNRVLNRREQQRADGRYMYAYKDVDGKQKYAYSWKLVPTDRVPSGKKDSLSLRELEEQIEKALKNQVAYHAGNTTVLQLVERYLETKTSLKRTTRESYEQVVTMLKKDSFGQKRIDKVKTSDAKYWVSQLQTEGKKSYGVIKNIRKVLKPAFQMAVEDDLLHKNPFQWSLSKVIVNDSGTREAITPEQEELFLEFIKNNPYYSNYYDAIYILFHTGLRISEFCGLTMKDIDLESKKIHINHQLLRTANMIFYIETVKTTSGERILPMTKEVYRCFERILSNRKQVRNEPVVDGYGGFLILDKNEMPCVAEHWDIRFKNILNSYNKMHEEKLPLITPHICRHTYCTRMARSGMNVKTLQYLMGHSDLKMTLGTYTHTNDDLVQEEVEELQRKGLIE